MPVLHDSLGNDIDEYVGVQTTMLWLTESGRYKRPSSEAFIWNSWSNIFNSSSKH